MRDKRETYSPRDPGFCDEPSCGGPVERKSRRTKGFARFCSKTCYRRYNQRSIVRGQRLYEAAIRWRGSPRSHEKGAKNPPTKFGDVTALLDEFLREDREMREDVIARMAAIRQKIEAALMVEFNLGNLRYDENGLGRVLYAIESTMDDQL